MNKYILTTYSGKATLVPESVHQAFMDANIPDNAVINWKTSRGVVSSTRKSAIASVEQMQPERTPALPEVREGDVGAPGERMATVKETTIACYSRGTITRETAAKVLLMTGHGNEEVRKLLEQHQPPAN